MTSKQAIEKIMKILNLTESKFYDAKTEQGIMVKMEGENLEVGKTLYVATDEGMIPAPAGIHKMEDGSEVEVDEEGKVSKINMTQLDYTEDEETDDAKLEKKKKQEEIKDAAMAESMEPTVHMEKGDIKLKDGTVLRIGGDIETGTNVKKVIHDGQLVAMPDGDYETSDGKVISIVGAEIKGVQTVADKKAEGGKFVEAKSGDVKLESPTFDVGEPIEVVKEDGSKDKAPDGEHQVMLKDSEGNEVKIRVMVKDGKIVERENVEEEPSESEDEMNGFIEAFAQAMKRLETKLDSISSKQELLETKFKTFSKEPAGSKIINNQINTQSLPKYESYRVEGFKRLREAISQK